MNNEATAPVRIALGATQLIANLAKLEGWKLHGDGAEVAIEKTFAFGSYLQTMAFANAVAYLAEQKNHHPAMLVQWRSCSVRFNTHDAGGVTKTDFECAALVDALVQH
jgi:4a-hydroxytetrahydrobiopterin dehydratase